MMKKINCALALLLFSFSGYAVAASSDSSPFDGFYAGAQLGMVYGLFQHTTDATANGSLFQLPEVPPSLPQPPPFPNNISVSDSASNLGADAGLHAGYGHVFAKKYYLGTEINGDFQTVSVSAHSIVSSPPTADTYATLTYSGRLANTYGIVLRPGYLISPTLMVYLKGGIQGSRLTGSSTAGYGLTPGAPVYSSTTTGSKEVMGWVTGIGIEKRASNHFGFRFEDLISGYGGVNASTTQTFSNGRTFPFNKTGVVTNSMHITPYTNVLMAGVDYYLG